MPFSKYEIFYIYDEPVIYKNLKIYPILMKDYLYFHYYASCILIEKDAIPDINVISMPYLDYMYRYSTEKEPYVLLFRELLKMILKKETYDDIKLDFDANQHAIFIIDNVTYNNDDFEEIKKIVCEQNLIELPDETVQKEIRDKLKEADRLKRENAKMGGLEDQIVSLAIYTGWKLDDIYNMTIRKFSKAIERSDHLLHYKIYLSASMSGFVEFKDKSFIKHWLKDLHQDKIKEGLIAFENVKGKLNFQDKK